VSALEAFWLGIVQGLTEFLPVSSSGHLVMLETLLGVEGEGGLVFEVVVHVATLLAIVIFFRRRVSELVVGALRGDPDAWRYGCKLGVATVPAVAVGLLAKDAVERAFASPVVAGACLLVTGLVVWTTRATMKRAHGSEPSWLAALLIGCAQAVAILPGISRSGSTVAVALALGVAPLAAAEFSFLMGVVAIAGAAVLTLPDAAGFSPALLTGLGVGALAALVSGVAAIWLFVRLLEHRAFHVFAYYAWAVGALFLAWLAAGAA
jgi:undecaprenyl-diphosphatase